MPDAVQTTNQPALADQSCARMAPPDRGHHQEGDQRVGREEHDPVVSGGVVIRRFLGEELVMRQGVAVVDAHQAGTRAVHDLGVQEPLEDVREDHDGGDDGDFRQGGGVDVLGGVPQGGPADQVDQRDVDQAGIGRGDLGAIGRSEGGLAGGHHGAFSFGLV